MESSTFTSVYVLHIVKCISDGKFYFPIRLCSRACGKWNGLKVQLSHQAI